MHFLWLTGGTRSAISILSKTKTKKLELSISNFCYSILIFCFICGCEDYSMSLFASSHYLIWSCLFLYSEMVLFAIVACESWICFWLAATTEFRKLSSSSSYSYSTFFYLLGFFFLTGWCCLVTISFYLVRWSCTLCSSLATINLHGYISRLNYYLKNYKFKLKTTFVYLDWLFSKSVWRMYFWMSCSRISHSEMIRFSNALNLE